MLLLIVIALLSLPPTVRAAERVVVAEADYVMADGDTLATAEERVLQRAKRKAIEEAGVYLESTFHDVERLGSDGGSTQTSALEIRTIAAAVTQTEVLELRRSIQHERPAFFVRIRTVVNLDTLKETVRRWQSDRQLTDHFRRLQQENATLKAQLRDLHSRPPVNTPLAIQPGGRNGEQARILLTRAMESHNFREKLELCSRAAALDPESPDALIVRGQTLLRLVSYAYAKRLKPSEYSRHVDDARMDFDRALLADPRNKWAFLGRGDVFTWLDRPDDAAAAYEAALHVDPLFDVARQRWIAVKTRQARKFMAAKQWSAALDSLDSLFSETPAESWIPYQKEALFLRGRLYKTLHRPTEAIQSFTMLLQRDPLNVSALVARGLLYRDQSQGGLARDDFEQACLLGSSEACRQLP